MGVEAKGRSGEPECPGSVFGGHVGPRGAGGVPRGGRLVCHTWPGGPSAGRGRACGSAVEFLSNHPEASNRPSVGPGRELRVGPGALLAAHWLVPRPGALLGAASSTPCPVLFLSCPTTPLSPLLGGGPGVWAWPAAGVPHECPGLGDKAGVSRPRAAVSALTAGAVTLVARDCAPSVGLATSPAGTQPLSDGVSGPQTSQQSPRCH